MLRSIHILCFSVLVGGIYFNQPDDFLTLWTTGVIISGLGMFAIDLYVSCIALFEIRGAAMLVKILLLILLPLTDGMAQLLILFFVVLFSSLISHSSRRVRHFNFLPLTLQEKYGLNSDNFNQSFTRNR